MNIEFGDIVFFLLQAVLVAMLLILAGAFVYAFFTAILVELQIYTDKLKSRRKLFLKYKEDKQ